jgi:hypothetical protein
MKKVVVLLALAALLVGAVAVLYAQEEAAPAEKPAMAETPWFDLENCAFCKNLTAEEGLMEHMTWENFVIPTGMMTVSTVAPGYEDKFQNAMKNMEETSKRLMAGEQLPMCGMCQSFGMIWATGKMDYKMFDTKAGHIELTTSSDPEVVAMIQKHAQRTIDEYAKLEQMEKPAEE